MTTQLDEKYCVIWLKAPGQLLMDHAEGCCVRNYLLCSSNLLLDSVKRWMTSDVNNHSLLFFVI